MKALGFAAITLSLLFVLMMAGCVTETKTKTPPPAPKADDPDKILVGTWAGIGQKVTLGFLADHTLTYETEVLTGKGTWVIENGTLNATIKEANNKDEAKTKVEMPNPLPTMQGGPIAPGYLLLHDGIGNKMAFERIEVVELKKIE